MRHHEELMRVEQIMPNVYGIISEQVKRYLLLGNHHALLFDTGYGIVNLRSCVERITRLPLYIINSHGHVDHAGGNGFFDQPAYLHEADWEVYRAHQQTTMRTIALDVLKQSQELAPIPRFLPETIDERAYINGPLFENFIALKEGDLFDLGGISAQAVEVPGHTPGSIGIFCPERELFLASDAFNDGTWLFLPESCQLSVYVESLQKVQQLDFKYFLTGHADELFPKAELDSYLAVAQDPDYEHGEPQPPVIYTPDIKVIAYAQKGSQDNRARIMISRDKL